jgi:adenylate cyclase class 2
MPRHEIEIKLRVADVPAIRRGILAICFEVSEPRHLERNFLFDFPDQLLRKSSSVIRLRIEGKRSILTFKGPPVVSARYKIRREIETEIRDGKRMREILQSLGLREVFCYEKYRTTFAPRHKSKAAQGEIVLDETPIGSFLELEGAKLWINKTARRLGFSPKDYVTASYASLYLVRCREEGKQPGNMVFPALK